MGSRVLVIGAAGVLGRAIADQFAAADFSVRRGVRRATGAADVALDLDRPETVDAPVADAALVVNTVPHPDGAAERAALRHGVLLLNVSSLTRARASALVGPNPRGQVVVHGGLVPGVSSLVARELVDRHPDADGIGIGMMFSSRGVSGPTGATFAFDALADRAHHRTRRLDVGALGTRSAFEVLPDERGWLGAIATGRAVHTYVSFAERSLHSLLLTCNAAHAMRLLPRRAFTRARGRRPLTNEPIVEWIGVERNSRLLPSARIECEGDYRATADAVLAQARALLAQRGHGATWTGVRTIEEALALDDIRADLARAGIRIDANR